MKTTNVILVVGATVLVGGGAFLFLKNKKKKDTNELVKLQAIAEMEKAKDPVLNPQTPTVKPEDKAKEDEAKGLATQIFDLKTQRTSLENQRASIPFKFSFNSFGLGTMATSVISGIVGKLAIVNKKLTDLELAIKKLGYKEVNGQAVKLVEVTTTKLV